MPSALHPARTLLNAVIEQSRLAADLDFCPLPSTGGAKLTSEAVQHVLACVANGPPPSEPQSRALRRVRQVEALLKKNPSIDGADRTTRKLNALRKFVSVQRRNVRAAKRFTLYLEDPSRMPHSVALVLGAARMDLFRLLGNMPTDDDWSNFLQASPFSSGTLQGLTRHDKRLSVKDTDAYAKVGPEQSLSSTSRCLRYYGPSLLSGSYGNHLLEMYRDGTLKLVESHSSIVSTQPKDASIDRAIATEPLLNAMAQRGCCEMLAPYLRKWGITLDDQKGNAKLARTASERGFSSDGFSTIDLSSASDTVLTPVVKHLMPEGWYDALDACRTGSWEIKDDDYGSESFQSHMFSSMGNGFTFPLQCLLYASLVRATIRLTACDDRRWQVYGDDMIVPTSATALLMEVLRFIGCSVNREKSYVVGYFRESCGSDWLNGYHVRPVYLKESLALRTARHSLFNRLQAVDQAHPLLGTLLESESTLLVGPAIGPTGGEIGHYVAPLFYLRKSGMTQWDPSLMSYRYAYTALIPHTRRRRRVDEGRRLLACMAGSPGPRHDIRGTVKYRVGVRVTTTPYVAAPTSPAWYSM